MLNAIHNILAGAAVIALIAFVCNLATIVAAVSGGH